MLEKQIENKLTLVVKRSGGIAVKFVSPSFAGLPDRLVLLPDGIVAFVELKSPGKKPRPLQLSRHRLLRSSFKNHKSKRFQSLMKVRPRVKRIIGLTGTPSSNGLMDLWAEFKLLDFGERLGRFITHYRNNYFIPDKRNGEIIYSYKPMPYAEDAIYRKISDHEVLFSYLFTEMEDLIMKEFWNTIQLVFAGIGGWLGYFLGGCDGLLYALVAFVVIDYITGIMCAISDKTLSSQVGFKGIFRKVLIFLLVGIAHILDVNVIGSGGVLRTAVIFFYISNEGVSLLENAAHLGLPVPEKIKVVLEQLHDRSQSKEE